MTLLDTLEQEEMWYGEDNFPCRVVDMEQSHRINVLAWLQRRAVNLYRRKEWHEEQALDALAASFDVPAKLIRDRLALSQSPPDWLNERPLVRALERAIKLHDAIEPDKLELEA